MGDDVDCRIARLGQVLSTSFTRLIKDLSSFLLSSFNQISQDVTANVASNSASFTAPPEVSVADRTLGHQPSPHPPVATVGHHQEFQVQGGVDREPPMTVFSAPPSGSAQRQVTFDSALSPVGSEEMEDDNYDTDSVTASAVIC